MDLGINITNSIMTTPPKQHNTWNAVVAFQFFCYLLPTNIYLKLRKDGQMTYFSGLHRIPNIDMTKVVLAWSIPTVSSGAGKTFLTVGFFLATGSLHYKEQM